MNGDLFVKMCKEATEDLASGEKGWRDTNANVLILACFGMLYTHLSHKLSKPLWWFAGSVSAGVITYVIKVILG